MINRISTLFVLGLFLQFNFAQDIVLTGRVITNTNAPIANAQISFPKYGLTTLTNSSGAFTLSGSAISIRSRSLEYGRPFVSAQNQIQFFHDGLNPVHIEIFDLSGHKKGQWTAPQMKGEFRVPLTTLLSKPKPGLTIIKIGQAKQTTWLKTYVFPSTGNLASSQFLYIDENNKSSTSLLKSSALDTILLSAPGYRNRSFNISALKSDLGDIVLSQEGVNGQISVSLDTSIAPGRFGLDKLKASLQRLGLTPQVVNSTLSSGQENILVQLIPASSDAEIKAEGFRIKNVGSQIKVTAIDPAGIMYGLLELAEQADLKQGISKVEDRVKNPRFPFRAVKFNLPWKSYRNFSALSANIDICRDIKLWESFLDMMAQSRLNALTLWGMHPWSYMIRAKNFPKATHLNDAQLIEWQTFWSSIFKMARDRGIDTYILNWNINVSQEFAQNYGEGNVNGFGNAVTSPQIEKYLRESITQVINEFPNLSGIGMTLGEGMEDMDPTAQADWGKRVFFDGIRAANRKAKFIYRAALKGDHTPHRAAIDLWVKENPANPIIVELKFNWSHGHSTTTLVKAHGLGTGKEYWTNPAPSYHKMGWMIRNEDFFRLRWGEPDFIREHIQKNGQDYVGGYFIGSEAYIPGKDIFTKPGIAGINWKFAFERQWLFYEEWGRLLYDPTLEDKAFGNSFKQRFQIDFGDKMVEAYKLASRSGLRIASSVNFSWDFNLYTEGMIGATRDFMTLQELINFDPVEPTYVSIKEFGAGTGNYGTNITPLKVASWLVEDNEKALAIVAGLNTSNATLRLEIEDIKAWANLGLYFAKKLRAAVAYNQNKKSEAVTHLQEAKNHWATLVQITNSQYQLSNLGIYDKDWHWSLFTDKVNQEINWVNAN